MRRMKRTNILISGFVLGAVFIELVVQSIIMQKNKKLDTWIGGYKYEEVYPHPSGEMYYCTDYYITIWKHQNQHYAVVEGGGWQLDAWGLAYVSGNDKKIEIISLQTLPGDSVFGRYERYEKGEVLVRLERNGEKINTEWCAMRNHVEVDDAIKGYFFEKVK